MVSDEESESDQSDLVKGDTVEAKCTGWTRYYSGTITRVNRDGTYDIKFEDGERKSSVKKSQIKSTTSKKTSRKSSSMVSDEESESDQSDLVKGDTVEAKCTGWTRYYSGTITRVNRDGTYDIKFEDGE
eukprot:Stramenopile-MAST_4_protein_6935